MTLYIIRHGETVFNRQNIVQGSGIDSDLNAVGRKQAQLFYNYYQNISFDVFMTSALKRTHQTIDPFLKRQQTLVENSATVFNKNPHSLPTYDDNLNTEKQLPWLQLQELNEVSWGIHEGKEMGAEGQQNFLKLMQNWNNGNYDTCIENGETAAQLRTRVSQVVDFTRDTYKGKNVLICTHGRTLLCMLTILKNLPLSNMSHFRHQNTCLYKVHLIDDEFIFELENDTKHLQNL